MRCSLCRSWNPPGREHCGRCRAQLSEAKDREVVGIGYLLEQVGKWGEQERFTTGVLDGLREEYGRRREALIVELQPPPPPRPLPPPEPIAAPARSALRVEPMRPVKALRIEPVARPVRPPFAWKNLYTEQNIRWVLNLGIFIFSIALAVFIRTQWRDMTPVLRAGILFGASAAAIGAGHFLRRTMLKATGLALILLGAIAIPIDCAALVEFGIVPPHHANQVGLWGSLFSLGTYVGLARLYSERRFVRLATLAAASAWAFLLRLCGLSWPTVVPWIAPLMTAAVLLGSRPLRQAGVGILGLSLLFTTGFWGSGLLNAGRDIVALEAAYGCLLPLMLLGEGKSGRREYQWGTVTALAVMLAAAIDHGGGRLRDHGLTLALVGAACSLGWWRKSVPFIAAQVVSTGLSLLVCELHPGSLAVALAIPAAIHVSYGLVRNEEGHSTAGWLLGALALLAGMLHFEVRHLWQPLALAGYGVLAVAVSHRRTPQSLQILGTLGAGAAMLLLALWYPQYYLPKPFPTAAAPPAGQWMQILGATIALASAFAFGPLANSLRSRFLSDITYGCLGFSYILLLRWAGVPGKWLGLSVALFGLAYALAEKRVSRWLLRPSFFTGVACSVAAGVFAFLQWFVYREYLQSALTLFLIGGFYLTVAVRTPLKGLFHVGVYLIVAGWLVTLQALGVPMEARALLTFLPAGLTAVGAARGRHLHLGLAGAVVATACLAVSYLDPAMYSGGLLSYLEAISVAAALLSGWFAFSRRAPAGIDDRVMSALMGLFASAGWMLWLKSMSTGSPWGGLAVFFWSLVLCGSAEALRRTGFARQGLSLAIVSGATTLAAILVAHQHGESQGVHLWVYGASMLLYTLLGVSFRRREFGWAGAAAGGAWLVFWLGFWQGDPWVGVWTFPLAALALLRRNLPLRSLGWLALILTPAYSALTFYGTPAAGLVFLIEAALLAATMLRPASLYPMILGLGVASTNPGWAMTIAFGGFGLYMALALTTRKPLWIYASLALALIGDYFLALEFPSHRGLAAYPLALLLLGMAHEVGKRFGPEFRTPLLGASFLAAGLATVLGFFFGHDGIAVFLADTLLFAGAAILFRLPALLYLSSASMVALALTFMAQYHLPRMQMAFYLLTLALAKMIFLRTCGPRLGGYFKPFYLASLCIASGVVLFGLVDHERALSRESLTWSIWALALTAAVFGIAGRIRKIPAFLYVAGANLLAGYYLGLHKYGIELVEAYTLPAGLGLAVWAALGLRVNGRKLLGEALALAVFFLPSALQSFEAGGGGHTLAALGIAFGLVLAGMAMKRRVYLFGGSGAFVLEVLAKAVQFLVDQKLSAAGWGMLVGGLMILLAALFESRKANIVRHQVELLRTGARKYFAGWE